MRGIGVAVNVKHIDLGFELFESFLVHDAKTLLFVDDEQTQVFELHIVGEQAMRRNHDIDAAGFQFLDDLTLFFIGSKTRNISTVNGNGARRSLKRIEMLLREHGRRHENRHLLAVARGFERGAQRHFGFAVSHIADDESIHRSRFFHIGFDVVNRAQLVFRFDVRKGRFEFVLPLIIRRKGVTRNDFARGVEFEQFVRNVRDRFLRAFFDLRPFRRTHSTQRRRMSTWRGIPAQAVDLMHRHVEHIAALIFDLQKFAFGSVERDARQSAKNSYAVIDVNDVIANRKIGKECFGRDGRALWQRGEVWDATSRKVRRR